METLIDKKSDHVDHFEHAIKTNKARLFDKLIHKSHHHPITEESLSYFHTIISLINEIYLYLRSPIANKQLIESIAHDLIKNSSIHHYSVHLTAVLASPTAAKEIYYFMRFFDIFNHFKIDSFITLLFIHWEDELMTHKEGYEDFSQKYMNIKNSLKYRTRFKLIPLHPEYHNFPDPQLFHINKTFYSYIDYYYCNIEDEEDKAWNKDKEWITNFYKRQESLKDLSCEKAIYDLAMRRAIGQFEREVEQFHRDYNSTMSFLLTSELNKRFINCYDSYNPILNLQIRD